MVVFFIILISFFGASVHASASLEAQGCINKPFIVTAYYSPLPGQKLYVKGSLEKDKILNGQGTHGASGQPVFDGMIAAPQTYRFGTEIYLPGWGWGSVQDRGGAIVSSGNRGWDADRLDLWFGHGDVGLIKALSFGVQRIQGRQCPPGTQKTLGDGNKTSRGFSIDNLRVPKHFVLRTLFLITLYEGMDSLWVKELRTQLARLGYPTNNQTSTKFDANLTAVVCSFQVTHRLITKDHKHCGIYGPQTRNKLASLMKAHNLFPSDYHTFTTVSAILSSLEHPQPLTDIQLLHHRLTLLGYDTGPKTQTMTDHLARALRQFQLAHQIHHPAHPRLGTMTNQTRDVLEKIRRDILEEWFNTRIAYAN
ncbi:MAG: peptidoglycan-binding protein [Candidatus Absconditabacterales bacterium]|nr:peptidoglycan-binding protein [Candidatus Absconditabacterales bacterium]